MNKDIEQAIGKLKGDDNAYANNYFIKKGFLETLYSQVRDKVKVEPFGNANSKIMFAVDFESSSDNIISLIKVYFERNGVTTYNAYFTQVNKSGSEKLDEVVLAKEIEIIQPNRIVIISDKEFDFVPNTVKAHYLSKTKMDRLCNRKELNLSKEETKLIMDEMTIAMKFAIRGEY